MLTVLQLGFSAAARAEEEKDDRPQELSPPTSFLKREGFAPSISLHGFGDITVSGEQSEPSGMDSSGTTGFAVGELDLFIVSHLTKSISFLTETVFEQDDNGHGVVDIERFWIKYTFSDRFWASIGRHHAPFGYWNRTYHHGLLLQPTEERPEALKFEDDDRGGFLPIHQVGLMSGGSAFGAAWRLDYVGGLFNGRGPIRDEVQSSGDANDEKAYAINLTFTRESEHRILFGPSLYHDDIPPDPTTPGRDSDTEERIYGAHFVYRDDRFEALAEYYRVAHRNESSASNSDHSAYFVIGIWRPWRWKPYVGFDRMNIESGDPFFVGLSDLKRYLGGVRFDLHPFVAVKFEYRHEDRPGLTTDALATQIAFTF